MGLLHDIGKLILIQILSELKGKSDALRELDTSQLFAMLREFHGQFGAVLLKRWNFSQGMIYIAMHHDHIDKIKSKSPDILTIDFANILVKSMGYTIGQQEEIDVEQAVSTGLLKIDSATIAEISGRVKEQMDELKGALS